MDGTQFNTWTRRRVGLAAGGFVASLLGLFGLEETTAKNDKPKKDKKGKKPKKAKRCKKLGIGCNPDGKRSCCSGSVCQSVGSLGENRCCQTTAGATCTSDSQCCGTMTCVGDENAKTCTSPSL